MKEAKKRALEYMGILSSFSLFCWASIDEYWSSNKYMSYVEKSRGKCGELLVSFNISSFLRVKKFATCLSLFIPHSTDSKENEYKLGCGDFWDRFWGGQALVMIGQWYSRQPSTNHKWPLSKWSQKSLWRKLAPIPLKISGMGSMCSLDLNAGRVYSILTVILLLSWSFTLFCLKQLLREIEEKDCEADREQEIEITWEPGLQEATEGMVTNKVKEKERKEMTPWETYLQNKKDKRKEKQTRKDASKKQ